MIRPLAAVLTIGDELLRGDVIDGNKAHLASALTEAGFEVITARTVRDRVEEIAATVRELEQQVQLIAVTGGLGPTGDDLTAEAIAKAHARPVQRHPQALAQIEAHFERQGRDMAPTNLKQADLPAGCELLPNPKGSAPGFAQAWPAQADLSGALGQGQGCVACMPGVPFEMRHMLANELLVRAKTWWPSLKAKPLQRSYRLMGLGESSTAQRLGDRFEQGWAKALAPYLPGGLPAPPIVHYRAHAPELLITLEFPQLAAWPSIQGQGAVQSFPQLLDHLIEEPLAPSLYAIDEPELDAQCLALLREHKLQIAVAESCTGGALAQRITAHAGASQVFAGGVVAYSNELKTSLLGVSEAELKAHGAVSGEVATAMAQGLHQRTKAPVCVSITGIAGPGGGSAHKPVGTVFVAVRARQELRLAHLKLGGDRLGVRRRAAQWALRMVVDALAGRSTWLGSHGKAFSTQACPADL